MEKMILAACAALVAGGAFATELKVGFSRVDITPPFGVAIGGYYVERTNKEILDPLEINCLAFSDGERTALYLVYDNKGINWKIVPRFLEAVSAATGLPVEAIFIHSTHTHCAGEFVTHLGGVHKTYLEFGISRSCDAAVMAIRDLKPATISFARSKAERISFNRTYLMKDGSFRTNPGTNNPDVVRPVGPADDTVQVLRIDRAEGKALCVINFQTHPDVIGGERISADWPGFTRRTFEKLEEDTRCVLINGTQGDLNHCNVMPRPGELNGLKRDFDAVDRGYDHAKHMGRVVAAAAISVWMKCQPLAVGPVRYGRSVVKVLPNKAADGDGKDLAWADEIMRLHDAGRDDEIARRYGYREMALTTELTRASRIRRMSKFEGVHEVGIYALTIGDSVAFGGFQGEPFNEIGVAIRKASPAKLTILSCITNGNVGYFPSATAFSCAGYEAASSIYAPSVEKDLTDGMIGLLKTLATQSLDGRN